MPAIGFFISTLFSNKTQRQQKGYTLYKKVNLRKLYLFYYICLVISGIVISTNIFLVSQLGGIFIFAGAGEAGDTYSGLALVNEERLPGLGTIQQISYSLPLLLATCQHIARQSNHPHKHIRAFNIITIFVLIFNSLSSLITGSRLVMLYPVIIYFFAYNCLRYRSRKQISVNKNKKDKGLFARIIPLILVVIVASSIVTVTSLRSGGGYKVSSENAIDNPIYNAFENLYAYHVAGFDVLNYRLELGQIRPNLYIPECNLRPVIPGYVRLFGDEGFNSNLCNRYRFHIDGHTSMTYLTPLPIDDIFITSLVLLVLGILWGISFVHYKRSILAYIIFTFITVGMLFSTFTNVVMRDFVFIGIIFLYVFISLLTLSTEKSDKKLLRR